MHSLLQFRPAPTQVRRKPSDKNTFLVKYLCLWFSFWAWGHPLGADPRLSGVTSVVHTREWKLSALGSKDEDIIFTSLFLPWVAHILWPISFWSIHSWSHSSLEKYTFVCFVLRFWVEEDPPCLWRAAAAAWQSGGAGYAFPAAQPGLFLGSCHGPEGTGTLRSASTGARLPAASAGGAKGGVTPSRPL